MKVCSKGKFHKNLIAVEQQMWSQEITIVRSHVTPHESHRSETHKVPGSLELIRECKQRSLKFYIMKWSYTTDSKLNPRPTAFF